MNPKLGLPVPVTREKGQWHGMASALHEPVPVSDQSVVATEAYPVPVKYPRRGAQVPSKRLHSSKNRSKSPQSTKKQSKRLPSLKKRSKSPQPTKKQSKRLPSSKKRSKSPQSTKKQSKRLRPSKKRSKRSKTQEEAELCRTHELEDAKTEWNQ